MEGREEEELAEFGPSTARRWVLEEARSRALFLLSRGGGRKLSGAESSLQRVSAHFLIMLYPWCGSVFM